MSNFIQRAITGILFIAVIGAALILSPVTYAVIMTCIITLGTHEYCRLVRFSGQRPHFFMTLSINVFAFTLTFLYFYQGIDLRSMLSLICLVWAVFLIELFSNNERPIYNIALTILGCVYIGLPIALVNFLAFKNGIYDFKPIAAFFILSWINDTGAYIFGVTLGRHKLYERISPKKTVEGFLGGAVFAMAAAIACYFIPDANLPLWFCVLTGLIVSIIGTCGDMVESMFKRSVNIKDSGRILPGHGGVLDRFDAFLFASPIVSLLYYFFV